MYWPKNNLDYKTYLSENIALNFLHFIKIIKGIIVHEKKLSEEIIGPIPEGIFIKPNNRIISVEVKRIYGLTFPRNDNNFYKFPWTRTIYNAIDKAHYNLIKNYDVKEHHVVFCIPSGNVKLIKRLDNHIRKISYNYIYLNKECICQVNKIFIHIISVDNVIFEGY